MKSVMNTLRSQHRPSAAVRNTDPSPNLLYGKDSSTKHEVEMNYSETEDLSCSSNTDDFVLCINNTMNCGSSNTKSEHRISSSQMKNGYMEKKSGSCKGRIDSLLSSWERSLVRSNRSYGDGDNKNTNVNNQNKTIQHRRRSCGSSDLGATEKSKSKKKFGHTKSLADDGKNDPSYQISKRRSSLNSMFKLETCFDELNLSSTGKNVAFDDNKARNGLMSFGEKMGKKGVRNHESFLTETRDSSHFGERDFRDMSLAQTNETCGNGDSKNAAVDHLKKCKHHRRHSGGTYNLDVTEKRKSRKKFARSRSLTGHVKKDSLAEVSKRRSSLNSRSKQEPCCSYDLNSSPMGKSVALDDNMAMEGLMSFYERIGEKARREYESIMGDSSVAVVETITTTTSPQSKQDQPAFTTSDDVPNNSLSNHWDCFINRYHDILEDTDDSSRIPPDQRTVEEQLSNL